MVGAQKKKHVTIDEDYTENLLLNLEKQKKEPCGGRQDVWDGFAYKTSEGLKKYDLIIGSDGHIVSKVKAILATSDNRLMTYMKKNR